MEEAVSLVRGDVSSIRTGRATPALVADILIETYGGSTKLKVVELASITTSDPRSLMISPWDKATLLDIKKGIDMAKAGFNPVVDGEVIRISLPALTAEDRQNYLRLLSQKLEGGRIMVRRARQEAMEETRSAFEKKEFGEDEKFLREERIQKLTDTYVGKIDEIGKQKEQELLSV